MLGELRKRAKGFSNIEVIEGDGNQLPDLLKGKDAVKPVVLSLQNSLGPWVGDWRDALSAMRKVAQDGEGEIVVSVFCQEGLKQFGIPMYRSAAGLTGEPDFERSDFEKGIYWSKTDYQSKWFTQKERGEMKQILGGYIVAEVTDNPAFYILHVSY